MKRLLITGGAGFIGSNLITGLLNSGHYHVICFDSFDQFYSTSQKEANILPFKNHKHFEFIKGDVRSKEDLLQIGNADVIIHLAAQAGVRQSVENPHLYYDVNLTGTINLLEFARERGIRQFVFASSSSVYGINNSLPWREDTIVQPISPYASSKHSAEMIGHVYSQLHNIRFLSLRFFSVYGMSQRPDLAVYNFLDAIINSKPINFFGDGCSSRDYTFVGDVCSAIAKAIEYDSSSYEVINIGNGRAITLLDLVKNIERVCNKKAIINYRPTQAGDVEHTYASISKAKALLGYVPKIDLQTGLSMFFNWYSENNEHCKLGNLN